MDEGRSYSLPASSKAALSGSCSDINAAVATDLEVVTTLISAAVAALRDPHDGGYREGMGIIQEVMTILATPVAADL